MSEEFHKSPDTDESLLEVKPEFSFSMLSHPINFVLVSVCVYLLYRILRTEGASHDEATVLPPMEKRDFTVQELRRFDGSSDERILIAVNGKVYDVTKGKRFYGPGSSYNVMAGRDATRSFAKFSVDDSLFTDEYDDVSDLTAAEISSAQEWEKQFEEKYDYVGRLLKPEKVQEMSKKEL